MFTDKDVRMILCGAYQENCYLIAPPHVDTCFVVDPGDDLDAIRRALDASGRKLEAILLTHGHFDHTLAAKPLAEEMGAVVYMHPADAEMLEDEEKASYDDCICRLPLPRSLKITDPGDEVSLCGERLRVLHTPGHSQGSVCFFSPDSRIIFTGDTLFRAGYGRTDLFGGDIDALIHSLRFLLSENIPDDTKVYSGHGSPTTISAEKRRYRL